MRTAFLALLALSFPLSALAAPAPPWPAEVDQALATIRPQAIRAHVRFLADDLLEGRRTGTRGYDLAAKYVATRFEALGLAPAGDGGGYSQPVPLVQMELDPADCSLSFSRQGQRSELKDGEDYLTQFIAEPQATVTAPAVYAGYGVTAPELHYDDYRGADVRGKVVVLLMGGPPTFPHDQRAYYSDRQVKVRAALERGAVAVLWMISPTYEKMAPFEVFVRGSKHPGLYWADEAGRPQDVAPGLRGQALLSRAGAEKLFAGASPGLDEVFKTAESGHAAALALPTEVSFKTTSRQTRATSQNVAAVLPGSDPALRDQYVVLSAHLDHLGIGEPVDGDSLYNGALDNASGVATLLEVAAAMARLPVAPRRSVLFLAVTGEEEGLRGSNYFAHHPTVPVDKIVADVNLDMYLMLYPLGDVVAFGAEHSSLGAAVEQAAHRLGVGVSPDPFPEQVIFIRSDHYSFVQQGVPAIFLTGGFASGDPKIDGKAIWSKWMEKTYHHPSDDMSQAIDFDAGAKFARLNFLISYRVAQDDRAPTWNPGDFFGDRFRPKVEKAR